MGACRDGGGIIFTRVINFRENQRDKIAILAEHHSISGVIRALLDVYTGEKSHCEGCLHWHAMNVIRARIRGQGEPAVRLFTISKLTKMELDFCYKCQDISKTDEDLPENDDIVTGTKSRDGSD